MYDPTKPYKHDILKLIESTWRTPYVRVSRGIYPSFVRKFNAPEVQHTDSIGTKGELHWRGRDFPSAVIDSLAMNLNDLAMVGARAYTLQNHIVMPQDDHGAILTTVRTLARECRKRKIAMTGGETSIQQHASFDISITVGGFIETPIAQKCKAGDVLIGIMSSGLHSNGFTRARAVLKNIPTTPTRIYSDEVLSILRHHHVHAMMHITGGAFSKLKDILGENDAEIAMPRTLRPQFVFFKLHERGVSSVEMYKTFNCGVGYILCVPPFEASKICKKVRGSAPIGHIMKGSGRARIQSSFDDSTVVL